MNKVTDGAPARDAQAGRDPSLELLIQAEVVVNCGAQTLFQFLRTSDAWQVCNASEFVYRFYESMNARPVHRASAAADKQRPQGGIWVLSKAIESRLTVAEARLSNGGRMALVNRICPYSGNLSLLQRELLYAGPAPFRKLLASRVTQEYFRSEFNCTLVRIRELIEQA